MEKHLISAMTINTFIATLLILSAQGNLRNSRMPLGVWYVLLYVTYNMNNTGYITSSFRKNIRSYIIYLVYSRMQPEVHTKHTENLRIVGGHDVDPPHSIPIQVSYSLISIANNILLG